MDSKIKCVKRADLVEQIFYKKTFLCVGLDADESRVPKHLFDAHEDPIFEFNKQIIDATAPYCVAYKPNTAFYEARGVAGWISLQKTIEYIPNTHFIIADAKRGDIGNTSRQYAKAFFESMPCDAVTVAPYMGEDSVSPFLEFDNKWVIVLGLTSNKGSSDFQFLKDSSSGKLFYQEVLEKTQTWGSIDNLMYVVGATHPEKFEEIRRIIPNHFLLVPGVGAQGGDLDGLVKYGKNKEIGLLVNSSRGIIFADEGPQFAEAAADAAQTLSRRMAAYF